MQVKMLTKASATKFTPGCKGPSFFPQLRQLLSVVEDSTHKSFFLAERFSGGKDRQVSRRARR